MKQLKHLVVKIFPLLIILLISSCGDRFYHDLILINSTKDSLYYYVHPYKNEKSYTYNIAYTSVDTGRNGNIEFKEMIDFSQNSNALKPLDSVRPSMFQRTWRVFSELEGGLTILLYKVKTLESKSKNTPLISDDIFKRIDLTNHQLDSLKFKVIIR